MNILKLGLIALASITCGIVIAFLLGDMLPIVPKVIAVALGAGLGAWAVIITTKSKP